MWNVWCLLIVSLVGPSYQKAPFKVLSPVNINHGEVAFTSNAYGFLVQRRGNTAVKNEKSPVSESFVSPRSCSPCTCGVLGAEGKIVSGKPTYVNKYPWMALYLLRQVPTCGASLINNKYVLTAAHCVYKERKKDMLLSLLEHNWMIFNDSNHVDFKVLKVIIHGKYNHYRSENNDIALLRLDTKGVVLGPESGIIPVCMPPAGKSFVGFMGIAAGWGHQKEHGSMSEVLRDVEVPILSYKSCRRQTYGITNNMICAGYPEGKQDACQGDSGGPLHVSINSVYYIVGIVSSGDGCGRRYSPGIYTRVNRYLDWIAHNTKDACKCSNHYGYLKRGAHSWSR